MYLPLYLSTLQPITNYQIKLTYKSRACLLKYMKVCSVTPDNMLNENVSECSVYQEKNTVYLIILIIKIDFFYQYKHLVTLGLQ